MAELFSSSLSYDVPSPHTPAINLRSISISIETYVPKIKLKSISFNYIYSTSTIIIDDKERTDFVYFKIDDKFGITQNLPSVYDSAIPVVFDLTKNADGGYMMGTDFGITNLTINLSATKVKDISGKLVGGDYFGISHGRSGSVKTRERISPGLWTTTTNNMPPFTINYEYEKYWSQDDDVNDGYLYIEGLATERPGDVKGIWSQDDDVNDGYLYIEGLATERPGEEPNNIIYVKQNNILISHKLYIKDKDGILQSATFFVKGSG